jgi:magnesium transporter
MLGAIFGNYCAGLANNTLSGSLFNRLVKEVSLSLWTNSGYNIVLGSHFLLNVELIIGVIVTALMSVILLH